MGQRDDPYQMGNEEARLLPCLALEANADDPESHHLTTMVATNDRYPQHALVVYDDAYEATTEVFFEYAKDY